MIAPRLPALRAAIIGCGTIAYEHLPFVALSDEAVCVALCDRSRAMADAAGRHFGLSVPLYTDADAMLAAEKPDIVHVLTPPQTHDHLVRAALAAGAHVICEKPMTGSATETAALIQAAGAADRVLVESRNLLFNDPVLDLLELNCAGRLGTVRECDILLSLDFLGGPFGDLNLEGPGVELPGGAVHDFLPHLVYLFQALTGAGEADRVIGEFTNLSGNPRASYDFCDVLVRAGQVRGRLRVATDVEPSAFRVMLRGSLGSVETDLYNPFQRFEGAPDTGKRYPLGQMRAGLALARAGVGNLRNKIGQHGTTHGLPRMLASVYTAIQEGRPAPISPAEMLATARLTDQILGAKECRMKVFVTGAGGFLGQAVVQAVATRGFRALALVRKRAPAGADAQATGVEDVRGDLRQNGAWREKLGEADAVIHCAAAAAGDLPTQLTGTVLATENLLAALPIGLKRFVHVSSFSVYDFGSPGRSRILDEGTQLEERPLRRDAYTQTKLMQEDLIRAHCRERGIELVVIRPGAIYGPGKDWDFGRAMRLGKIDLIFAPFARMRLVHVDDCARALVAALDAPVVGELIVNIVGDEQPTHWGFHRRARKAGALVGTPVPVPYTLVRAIGGAAWLASRLFFKGKARLPEWMDLPRQEVRWRNLRYPATRAQEQLGWREEVRIDPGIRSLTKR